MTISDGNKKNRIKNFWKPEQQYLIPEIMTRLSR